MDDIRVLVPGAPPSGFSVSDAAVSEGHAGATQATFTVSRSSGTGAASIRFATADATATAASGDYQPASGTLTFAPGETRKTVTVAVNGDRLAEADEHFVLNLSNPTGAAIADGQGAGTIRDDEPRILIDSELVGPEGDTQVALHVPVNLSPEQPAGDGQLRHGRRDGRHRDRLPADVRDAGVRPGRDSQGDPGHPGPGPDRRTPSPRPSSST